MSEVTPVDDLRRLAEAATPGPWEWDGRVKEYTPRQRDPFADFGATIERAGDEWNPVVQGGAQDEQGGAVGVLKAADAAYIAACSPDRILALLDRLAAAESQREALDHDEFPLRLASVITARYDLKESTQEVTIFLRAILPTILAALKEQPRAGSVPVEG